LWTGNNNYLITAMAAAIFIATDMLAPAAVRPLCILWMVLAVVLGAVMKGLILGLVF
jgi:hypothetical protein